MGTALLQIVPVGFVLVTIMGSQLTTNLLLVFHTVFERLQATTEKLSMNVSNLAIYSLKLLLVQRTLKKQGIKLLKCGSVKGTVFTRDTIC